MINCESCGVYQPRTGLTKQKSAPLFPATTKFFERKALMYSYIIFVVLNIFDMLLTFIGVQYFGGVEGNVLLVNFINNGKYFVPILAKIAGLTIMFFLVKRAITKSFWAGFMTSLIMALNFALLIIVSVWTAFIMGWLQ